MESLFKTQMRHLPHLGVGLGLRHGLFDEIMAHRSTIDWLEIVPENFMGKGGHSIWMLEEARSYGFPMVSHGVNLSIGSVDPLSEEYLRDLAMLFQRIDPPWFSDHLCFSSVDGVYLNDLLPLPFTWEAVHHIVPRIRVVQERLERPFLIENISYYATMGPQELTEAQFLAEILERSDCGLLLDVNNIFVNAQNHGYDPGEFLNAIPLERVVQLHVAGHLRQKHLVVDTHAEPVCSEVWDLLAVVIQRTCAKGILLERDDNLPPIDSLLSELDQIRSICHSSGKSNGVSLPLGVHQK